ncbi:MAG: MCE family protein [Nocardioides sp.]|uniref:MCE family protein n=1 Tax=Nocardioides sp. TaxID=35761 RepID=UPI0039E46F6E
MTAATERVLDLVRRMGRRTLAVVVAVALLLGAMMVWHRSGRTTIDAYFSRTDGIYAGDEVRVLGIPVGRIDSITPMGSSKVRVRMTVDRGVQIPSGAKAAIVAPSLISSRYVQLTPRYAGGATLHDGATIPLSRTAVPVEWDTIKDQLDETVVALGPNGANKDGAVNDLVTSTADTLKGNSATINGSIQSLAAAIRTLDAGGDDLFSTIRNLQVFVSALRGSDDQITAFAARLDEVSGALDGDGKALRSALHQLGEAVGEIETFVKKNRSAVNTTVSGLADVTATVAARQAEMAQFLHVAPNALANLNKAYHQRQNAVAVDLMAANIHSPGQLICGAIAGVADGALSAGQSAGQLCSSLIGDLLDQVGDSPASQQLFEALLLLLSGGTS